MCLIRIKSLINIVYSHVKKLPLLGWCCIGLFVSKLRHVADRVEDGQAGTSYAFCTLNLESYNVMKRVYVLAVCD